MATNPLSTSQIRELRDAAERADDAYRNESADVDVFLEALRDFEQKANCTTVKALCDQAIRCLAALDRIRVATRICDPQFRAETIDKIINGITSEVPDVAP